MNRLSFVALLVLMAGSSYAVDVSGPIDYPGATLTNTEGLNDHAAVAGQFRVGTLTRGFLGTDSGFTEIRVPGASSTIAHDINNANDIVGNYFDSTGAHGFVFSQGQFQTIDHPTGDNTNLTGLNNQGHMAGTYFDGIGRRGFSYDGTTFTPIDYPGAEETFVTGISNNGLIVGYYDDGVTLARGFVYDGSNYLPVDYPGALRTFVEGVNSSGVVVGTFVVPGAGHGFTFDGSTYQTLDYPVGTSTNLRDINDVGQITGTFQTSGTNHGFIANLAPVPDPMTPLTDSDPTSANAQYTTLHENSVGIGYDAADVGDQQGTIRIDSTWAPGDFSPHVIEFQQEDLPTSGFTDDEGARWQLLISMGNHSGRTWKGFTIHTEDDSVPDDITPDETDHLANAHFHANSSPNSPMLTGLTRFDTLNAFDNTQMIEVSGGRHHDGRTFGLKNFYLHERNFTDGGMPAQSTLRNFTLVLTPVPVPEPTTWSVLAISSAMPLLCRRRRAERRGSQPCRTELIARPTG